MAGYCVQITLVYTGAVSELKVKYLIRSRLYRFCVLKETGFLFAASESGRPLHLSRCAALTMFTRIVPAAALTGKLILSSQRS
jgi:hypothetical protein